MATVTIEAQGLTKRYGSRTAVRDLSITARQGDIVGLLGPNGSGKTTTIRLLTTVLAPTAGTFSVAGIPASRPLAIRQRVGVLPESSGYPGQQSGREYLRYHARLFGRPRAQAGRVADDLLAEVGLADRAASRIATYSRGMRQRLGIARALVNDPAVVFLDEPTLGLDPAGQRQVLGTVREIAYGRGATVVLSTHALTEVEEVCTSAIILSDGNVLISGPISEVTRAVVTRRSATLRVPVDQVDRARGVLRRVPGATVTDTDGRSDVLRVTFGDATTNEALAAVLAADVTVLAFEVEGIRLSSTFLAMTGDGAQ
jgi:ABC-2 type transport system ATP-binding protein